MNRPDNFLDQRAMRSEEKIAFLSDKNSRKPQVVNLADLADIASGRLPVNNSINDSALNGVMTLANTIGFINNNRPKLIILTLIILFIITIVLISIAFDRLGLKDRSCDRLHSIYGEKKTNKSYFNDRYNIKSDARLIFDNSNSTLINFLVKSAYNCCCGDGYKDNFVAICALEKCIANGCRFLDFEIYSYNNDPIVASSIANSNYIKQTYNALLLSEVLASVTENAFDKIETDCANDPLILNFRVMSTNLTMLEKMGNLFEEYLDRDDTEFKVTTYKDNTLLNSVKMSELYKKIIIICDLNPDPNLIMNPKLAKLKTYINLKGKGLECNTYRLNDIIAKGNRDNNPAFVTETTRKYTIVLPNIIDNSISNFDSMNSIYFGCQAICMKHQQDPTKDSNLEQYNKFLFENATFGNYSWRYKGSF